MTQREFEQSITRLINQPTVPFAGNALRVYVAADTIVRRQRNLVVAPAADVRAFLAGLDPEEKRELKATVDKLIGGSSIH